MAASAATMSPYMNLSNLHSKLAIVCMKPHLDGFPHHLDHLLNRLDVARVVLIEHPLVTPPHQLCQALVHAREH